MVYTRHPEQCCALCAVHRSTHSKRKLTLSLNTMDEISDGRVHYKSENQFSRSFTEFNSLRRSEQLCDVVLVVEGERLPAHRVILASLSAYFRAMFTGKMAESTQREIVINDIEPSALRALVDYAYTATIELTQDNVQSILPAASVLQFDEVKEACSQFLLRQLDADNCLGIKGFAEVHGCNHLRSAASIYSSHYFSQVRKRDEFLKLPLDEVKDFLGSNQLNIGTEYEVFEAAMEWLNHNGGERVQYLYEILSLIRLPLLSAEQLLKMVGKNALIKSNPLCVELLMEAIQCHMLPDTRQKIDPRKLTVRKPHEKIYAIGGWDGSTAVNTVECYDTETGNWEEGCPTLTKRNGVGLAFTNGLLYAIGGHDGQKFLNTAEVFDPRTSRWHYIASLHYKRASTGVAVQDHYIYAIGGQDGTLRLKSAERYNLLTDEWEVIASMNMRRDSPGVVLHGDFIYAIGGCHACMFLDSVEKYSPKENRWYSAMHMIHRRSAVGVVVLGNCIYAFGGHNEQSNLAVMERYDPKSNTWTQLASMNSPRAGVGSVLLDGKIIAIGGYDGTEQLSSVEQYDPATDTWSYMSPMKHERSYVGAVSTIKVV